MFLPEYGTLSVGGCARFSRAHVYARASLKEGVDFMWDLYNQILAESLLCGFTYQ